MTKIPEIIIHYQKSISKCGHDKNRLLHCITKLDNLPITVQHLQETGIGRTVNSLRKDDGDVGNAAKDLVNKWKDLVAAEESNDESGGVGGGSDGGGDNHRVNNNNNNSSENMSTAMGIDHENNSNDEDNNIIEIKKEKTHSHKSGSSSSTNSHKSHNHHKSSSHEHRKIKEESTSTPAVAAHHAKSSINNSNSSSSSKEYKSKDHEKSKHHKSSSSTSKSSSSSSRQHKTTELIDENEIKKENRHHHHHHHHSKDESTSKSSKSSSSHKHSSSNSKPSSSSRSSTHTSNTNEIDLQKVKKESHHNDEIKLKNRSTKDVIDNKEHKSRSERSSSNRHDDTDRKKHLNKRSPSSSVSPTPLNPIKKPKSEHQHDSSDQIDEIDSTMGTSFAEALGMMIPTTSSSSSASSKKQKTSQKLNYQTPVIPTQRIINNNTAATTVSSSSTKKPSSSSSSSDSGSIKKDKRLFEKTVAASSSTSTSSSSAAAATPALLKSSIHLAPLEPELALEIPTISNNYRPAPLNSIVMDCVYKQQQSQQPQQQQQHQQQQHQQQISQPVKRFMTEEELGASMSSKTQRTKVYSGVKTGAILNCCTLRELCMRVLQKNIDALEYTGGVPFDILKPVLERASPQQLLTLEDYNSYLINDTNELWEFHCKRKFRTQKRMEMESWREMFMRCTDEQDARLSSLTENIKLSQTVAVPVKQTKITFVDSIVKPPREIIKRQNKFGTERVLVATPAARVATLNNTTANIAKVGDVRLRVAAGLRDNAQVGASSSSAFRPKKAPLMAKTLQLMKGRFKR